MPVTVNMASTDRPYRQIITVNNPNHPDRRFTLFSDSDEGDGMYTAPSPGELLLSAIGSCSAMTVQAIARKNHIPLEDIKVTMDARRDRGQVFVTKNMEMTGPLTAQQKALLEKVANGCHVQRAVTGNRMTINSNFSYWA